jgi:hypothetical protein
MGADSKVRTLPLVNKTWNRACQSPASWHSIRVSGCPRQIVGMSSCKNTNNKTIVRLAPRLSRIEVLWYERTQLSDSALSLLLGVCGTRLRELSINCTDRQFLAAVMSAPSLQFVHVQQYVSALGLAAALPFLRKLKSIRADSIYLVRALHDINSRCPFLETYHGVFDEQLATSLSQCEHLTDLNLFNDDTDMTTTMTGLLASVGRNLRSIDFPKCEGSVVLPLVAKHCEKLQKLFIALVSNVTDALMEEVLCHCGSTLVYVRLLEDCTDASLVNVASHCPNLTVLNLNFNKNITDAGMAALAASCTNLRQVGIRWTDLSHVSLLALVEHPLLRYVAVSGLETEQQLKDAHTRRAELGLRPIVTDDSVINIDGQFC